MLRRYLFQRRVRHAALTVCTALSFICGTSPSGAAALRKQPAEPVAIPLQIVPAARASIILRRLFPGDKFTAESDANTVIVRAPAEDLPAVRQVISAIDVKNPSSRTVDAIQTHFANPTVIAEKIRSLFPSSKVVVAPNRTLLVSAVPQDSEQIKSLIAAIDAAPATPTPAPEYAPDSVRVAQGSAKSIARTVARAVPHARIAVSGSAIVLSGPPDDVSHAKQLIAQLDQPDATVKYTQVYRLRFIDAASAGDLLKRSFRNIDVQVDKDLNALTVLATYSAHQRISGALAQLDAAPGGAAGAQAAGEAGSASSAGGGTDVEVVTLHAATPGLNGSPSTSASDIAQTISQTMQSVAPDLHVTVPANSTQLVLTGSPYSISLAKRLISQLDVAQPLVVLDTEILEVDESVAKNLGLQLASPLITSNFSEMDPPATYDGYDSRLMGLQALTRTKLSLGLQLNLLIQNGQARILADPRITVISGRTANIRAGDTIAILTTTGGGTGTVATTQLQTFQTGVTLDITPVVNAENYISVSLHPTVNSLEGLLNGVPQIATRDAQTTVGLQEDQTLVIGGLIQDTTNRSENKMPILGDLPVIGRVFRNQTLNKTRNELIVTVTPHILKPGQPYVSPGPPLPAMPTAQPLPTLAPDTVLPNVTRTAAPAPRPNPTAAPPVAAPNPTAAPASASVAAVPAPTPSAFANLNVFTYGQAPASNYARDVDPAKIFYVQFSPTVIRNNTSVTVSAITSTNVKRLTVTYGQLQTQIASTSPGVWQSSYNFATGGGLGGQTSLTLTAYKNDGTFATVTIPVTIITT
jgi:type II secretory pathway component GspD/PulD (secretin)